VKVSQEEFERRLAYVQALEIGHGSHDAPAVNGPASGQACVMEMVAYVAGEPWSDHPKCACPVITSFLIRWNDDLPDADRTRLIKPLIPKVADTRSTKAVEERRSFMALDWLIREHTPAWLGLVPALAQHVDVLKALGEVCDMDSATAAGNAVRAAQKDADAAWAAARTLRGTLRGPLRGTLRGPLRGTLRGTLRGPLRGTLRGPLRGTLRGTLRGPLRGTLRGTLRGPLRGTLRGTLRGNASSPPRRRCS
jgi:hypothetical protein